jgi:hypothetical protein
MSDVAHRIHLEEVQLKQFLWFIRLPGLRSEGREHSSGSTPAATVSIFYAAHVFSLALIVLPARFARVLVMFCWISACRNLTVQLLRILSRDTYIRKLIGKSCDSIKTIAIACEFELL